MAETTKITFVVPNSLAQELKEQVIKKGYGMRGKSKWISESIQQLLATSNYPELVNLGAELTGLKKTETIVISKDLKYLIDQAIVATRRLYPTLEGVQSGIVRTAIIQKLLREGVQ